MSKICFLGDSITQGTGASSINKRFSALTANMLNAEELNFGVGGTRIAKQTVTHCTPYFDEQFIVRAKKMPDNVDLVIVFGGTNDWGHGDAPIGNKEDNTRDTFYGAARELVDYLVHKYPLNKLLFILPLPRWNENDPYGEMHVKKNPSLPLEGYRQIIISILKEYGVRYVSFDKELPAPDSSNGGKYHIDNVHPNDNGHRILAEALTKYIKDNKLL